MKKTITYGLILICSIFLFSGCSYSDLTGKNTDSGSGNVGNVGNTGSADNDTPSEKIFYWEPSKTFTVPNIADVTIASITGTEEIKPPKTNSVYSYYKDKAGETYVLAKGTFKNLLADTFDDWDNFDGKLIYDGNYEYNVNVAFATDSDNDFYTDPKPLQTLNVYFYASVPSEIIKTDKTFTLKLQFIDNNDVSSDIYQYSFVFNND